MRIQALFLFLLVPVTAFCESTRIGQIKPGMTRTDVAIELGKPYDTRVDGEAILWVYPGSRTQTCVIKFVKQRVSEPVKCEQVKENKEAELEVSQVLVRMSSDVEYQGRVLRYCGKKPIPHEGCKISEHCINGGWEEICQSTSSAQ